MTLIEVLVAVLVLSVALLGALKLQNEGVRLNADSRYTIIASAYAHDALDALSFDRAGNRAAWTSITTASDPGALQSPASSWLAKLKNDLPDGKATVSCSSTDKTCHVSISWSPPGRDTVTADFYTYDNGS